VPSDGWAQLLLYRKDWFDQAGLSAPKTYDDIEKAAAKMKTGDHSGITLATAPGDSFTQQTFEHLALANGCQLVDAAGAITLTSPNCVQTSPRSMGRLATRMLTRPEPPTSPARRR
jgi:multiple sugar transport system substrate-binding protein